MTGLSPDVMVPKRICAFDLTNQWKNVSKSLYRSRIITNVHTLYQLSFLNDSSYKKRKFCHCLPIVKLFQNCMSLFLLLNTKEGILKNVGNANMMVVDGSHLLP